MKAGGQARQAASSSNSQVLPAVNRDLQPALLKPSGPRLPVRASRPLEQQGSAGLEAELRDHRAGGWRCRGAGTGFFAPRPGAGLGLRRRGLVRAAFRPFLWAFLLGSPRVVSPRTGITRFRPLGGVQGNFRSPSTGGQSRSLRSAVSASQLRR